MSPDDDLLPISGLQHLVFCRRQCALIHVERFWRENRHTAEGRQMHERVHGQTREWREGRLVARGLPLLSRRLGLIGQADVVEFVSCQLSGVSGGSEGVGSACSPGHGSQSGCMPAEAGIELAGQPGRWRPFPVEYKRGRPKKHDADAVQLCAQALCLEEMLGTAIPAGALFYGKTRRRLEVSFDEPLRRRVAELAGELHRLVEAAELPRAEYGPKCKLCSLRDLCMPKAPRSAGGYVRNAIRRALAEPGLA